MSIVVQLLSIVVALVLLSIVVVSLRRQRLRERHAVWWLLAGVVALILAVFPPLLEWAADLTGIATPSNLLFFVGIATVTLVSLQQSSELTQLESKTRVLAEEVALLRRDLEDLRGAAPESE